MPRKITPETPPGLKWCHGCAVAYPVHTFHRSNRTPDGRVTRCRGCVRRRAAERQSVYRLVRAGIAASEARQEAEQAAINAAYGGPHTEGPARRGFAPNPYR